MLLQNDLKFKEWLYDTAQPQIEKTASLPTDPNRPIKASILYYEVKFDLITSGSASPGWKLVNATINQSGTFLNAKRDRTHDLQITLGLATVKPSKSKEPNSPKAVALSDAAANTALAGGFADDASTPLFGHCLPFLPLSLRRAADTVVLNGDRHSFDGMNALAGEEAPGRPLYVLLVHGMGTPTPNGFDPFIASLAGRFGLVQIPPPDPISQWQSCHQDSPAQAGLIQPAPESIDNPTVFKDNRALLYTYNFAPHPTDPPALKVSYLLWAPLTAQVKCGLEGEDGSAPQKQAFAAIAKDFIDDKLADALLCAGSYRKEVIPSPGDHFCWPHLGRQWKRVLSRIISL
jgi:hypothetical protein